MSELKKFWDFHLRLGKYLCDRIHPTLRQLLVAERVNEVAGLICSIVSAIKLVSYVHHRWISCLIVWKWDFSFTFAIVLLWQGIVFLRILMFFWKNGKWGWFWTAAFIFFCSQWELFLNFCYVFLFRIVNCFRRGVMQSISFLTFAQVFAKRSITSALDLGLVCVVRRDRELLFPIRSRLATYAISRRKYAFPLLLNFVHITSLPVKVFFVWPNVRLNLNEKSSRSLVEKYNLLLRFLPSSSFNMCNRKLKVLFGRSLNFFPETQPARLRPSALVWILATYWSFALAGMNSFVNFGPEFLICNYKIIDGFSSSFV